MNLKKIICEECEESGTLLYCLICEQYICYKCDLKIHNKGKRIKHQRDKIDIENFQLVNLLKNNRAELSKNILYVSETMNITLLTKFEKRD